jgi:hypothetical protein
MPLPRIAALLLLLLLPPLHAAAYGQEKAPANPEDSPREAVRRCMLAFASADPATLRDAILPGSDLEADVLKVWAANLAGQNKLQEAVRRRFGEKAVEEVSMHPDNRPRGKAAAAEVDKVIRALDVRVERDTATLTHPGNSGGAVRARRTNGKWKIIFASVFPGGVEPARLRRYQLDNHYMPPVFDAVAGDVAAGRIATPDDVVDVLTTRLAEADAAARAAADARPLAEPTPPNAPR